MGVPRTRLLEKAWDILKTLRRIICLEQEVWATSLLAFFLFYFDDRTNIANVQTLDKGIFVNFFKSPSPKLL